MKLKLPTFFKLPKLSRPVIIILVILPFALCGLYMPYLRSVFTEVRTQQTLDTYLYPDAEFVTELRFDNSAEEAGWVTKRRIYWTPDPLEAVQAHYAALNLAPANSTVASVRFRVEDVPEWGTSFTFTLEDASETVVSMPDNLFSPDSGTLITYNALVWRDTQIVSAE